MVDGQWPWETGDMPETKPAPKPEKPDDFLYRLPRIKDRHTKQMRAMAVQEMMARKAPRSQEPSPHDW